MPYPSLTLSRRAFSALMGRALAALDPDEAASIRAEVVRWARIKPWPIVTDDDTGEVLVRAVELVAPQQTLSVIVEAAMRGREREDATIVREIVDAKLAWLAERERVEAERFAESDALIAELCEGHVGEHWLYRDMARESGMTPKACSDAMARLRRSGVIEVEPKSYRIVSVRPDGVRGIAESGS